MQFLDIGRTGSPAYRLINDHVQLVWRSELGLPMRWLLMGTATMPVQGALSVEQAQAFWSKDLAAIQSAMIDDYLDVREAAETAVGDP